MRADTPRTLPGHFSTDSTYLTENNRRTPVVYLGVGHFPGHSQESSLASSNNITCFQQLGVADTLSAHPFRTVRAGAADTAPPFIRGAVRPACPPPEKKTISTVRRGRSQQDRFDRDNREVALTFLRDPDRYAGIRLEWAREWARTHELVTSLATEGRKP